MKKIDLIGAMSWKSTKLYYQNINTEIKALLGKHHSAELTLESVDLEVIKNHQHEGNWQAAADILISLAQNLEKVGADLILICTNIMHKVANEVADSVGTLIVHLANATAEKKLKKLGTPMWVFLASNFLPNRADQKSLR